MTDDRRPRTEEDGRPLAEEASGDRRPTTHSGPSSPVSGRSIVRHQSVPCLVSIIIPVFNRAAMLREAVASVVAQTYRPIEIIIVDDGSTAETARAVDDFGEQNPNEILVVHQDNTGPGLAREAGRQLAKGAFIQYLDSYDILLP